jgi:hypothetical protein
VKGHGVTLGLVVFACIVYGLMSAYFSWINQQRTNGKEDDRISGLGSEEVEELGDRNPRFVYTV